MTPATLKRGDFNAMYFGDDERFKDRAGYTNYTRNDEFARYAKMLFDRFDLAGKKVLDVGCAKGFLVKSLNDLAVNAVGIDWSAYAIGQAEDGNATFIREGTAPEDLKLFKDKEFDLVCSFKFLSCIPESRIGSVVTELNRISKQQFHEVDAKGNDKYYNIKSLDQWKLHSWNPGTVLKTNATKKEVIT